MRFPATGLTEPKIRRTAPGIWGTAVSTITYTTLALSVALLAPAALAQPLDDGDGTVVDCGDGYNQYRNPYFGDTHVHTGNSVDAFIQGTNTTPDEAYLYAKGNYQLGVYPYEDGSPTRFTTIDRPLDFAVVTDHAELFGEQNICLDPTHPLYLNTQHCIDLRMQDGTGFVQWNVVLGAQPDLIKRYEWCYPYEGSNDSYICTSQLFDTWHETQAAAATHYTAGQTQGDPTQDCTFTTFVGYEWTGAPTAFGGRGLETLNLHRNVIFKNSNVPERPYSYLDNGWPEILWNFLEAQCQNLVTPSGECDVLTIPHNSNLSQGKIFELIGPNGPYNFNIAKKRKKFEPLVEIMQHKGQSECLATSADELCDFEAVPFGHLAGGGFLNPTEPQIEGTIRHALKDGISRDFGHNPFTYGLIGSSDTHLGAAGGVSEEAGYLGHGGASGGEDGAAVFEGISDLPEYNPGGLAVVWATQNSRAALFDAMKRREVYGTSGPRHIVRFFGGWDLPAPGNDCSTLDIPAAYGAGTPMGGALPRAGAGQTKPQFLVAAYKDPLGYDLQRIQIIKGWVDDQGNTQEAVYDVAGTANNGADVNLDTCDPIGTGDAQLCGLWTDQGFDADQKAFYYARVVENPSCRWTQHQCLVAAALPAPDTLDCDAEPPVIPTGYGACCDTNIPKTVQERSWASPVWYIPPTPGC